MTAAATAAPATLDERLLAQPHAHPPTAADRLPLRPRATLGVLDCSEWFGPTSGGVRTYLLQKAAYVEARPSLRQVLVVPGARRLVGSGDGVRCHQLRSPPVPGRAPYRALLDRRSAERIVAAERPDIIEIGSPLAAPWLLRPAARRSAIPMVCYHHGLLPHNFSTGSPGSGYVARAAARLGWRHLRRLDRSFALTLVGSDFAAAALRSEGIERTLRIPLGVELARFHPRRRDRALEVRRAHGLPANRPVVGFVGRLAPEKELEVAIRGWGEVAARRGAVLVLVGGGPLLGALRAAARDLPVHIIPFVRDRDSLADLVASFDLFLSPGSMETFGLAALEALASGVPVLSADRGGVAEQIACSGAGGAFEAGQPGSLAEGAISLLDSDLGALGARGREYAERNHSWDRVFDRIFDAYRAVLAGREPDGA